MENNSNEEIKYYNLTIPQENIWLTEQLNPNTNINHIYGTISFNQKLDIESLKLAINKTIETNDALRIKITLIDNIPFQFVDDYYYEEIPTYLLDESEEYKINEITDTIRLENMNILNNKLFDIRIIQTSSQTYLSIKTHHIISDAWSTGQLLVEQIKYNYDCIKYGKPIFNQPSYLDFIKNNINYQNTEKYIKDEQFWKKYIKNISCINNFETVTNTKCNRLEKSIDTNLVNEINYFCENNNISAYSFFLSILSIYFSKIFDKKDLIFGTPFLNRKKINHEIETMGMFISTLPLYIELNNSDTFLDICKQVTSKNLSCFKHSSFPYSKIQKEYQIVSGQNTNLYEIVFSYQINKLEQKINDEIGITNWICNQTQNTPLLISFVNHFGENKLCYDYLLQLFCTEDIEQLHERLISIIKQVLKNSSLTIPEIKLLTTTDISLLEQFNSTGNIEPISESIIDKFEKIVQKNKTKTALKYMDTEITYQELNKKINSVANYLIKHKIKKGSPIAIIFDKSPAMFITMFGIMKAGCYYIPILPEEEQGRAEYIIKNSEAVTLITEKKYSTQISNNIIESQLIIDDLLNESTDNPEVKLKPNDLCYLIYTSGSTGTPKGVMLKHENVISLITSMNQHEDLKVLPDDIAISLLKYSFDAFTIDVFTMLLNGGKLVIVPKEIELNAIEVCKIIEKEKVTRFFTVTKWIEQVQNISKQEKIDLSSIHLIGTGGEVLKPNKFEYLHKAYPNLKFCNTYGPTETTVLVTSHRITDDDVKNNVSPIGNLIPYTRAMVMSHGSNEVLPINTKGELVIFEDSSSVHNISNGYFKLENKTKENFIDFINPITKKKVKGYKTGDIVKINKNLELDFFGRNDDFKKINGGYLVSLTEVETRIQTILGNLFDICIVSIPIRNINSIILFISKKSEALNITIDDIKNELNQKLTFYMRPKQIIEIDKMPFTNNGKVNKKLLEKQAIQYLEDKTNIIKPTNKTEQTIYDIVHEIVNSDFSITDDFEDDLGIDSLNMTILYSKLNNSKISIQDLYNYPNVKDLAYLMKKELTTDDNLEPDSAKIQNASSQMDLEKVLLTGATGFVGSHLLKELSDNENVKKIYCIVRQKLNQSSEERFYKIINTYFDEEACKQIKKKVVILNGDLRKENLGLDDNTYNRVFKDVTTIINAAANVKHIGKYHTSYIDNVQTVKNLINACTKFNISLAHISTLSLNGYNSNNNVTQIFNENTLNIHQTFNKNPYLISKFEAEQTILKSISEENLNAKIFRIGNIMPRISDGVFQINYEQNGFLLAINSLCHLNVISEEITDLKIRLTPVDDCCKAICAILGSDYCNTIYHIENDKWVKISTILDILSNRNICFSKVSLKSFMKALDSNYSIGIEYLKSLMNTNVNKYSNSNTSEILEKIDFKWNIITKNYIENIINLSTTIKS